jgi:hypothetical protein
LQEQRNSLLEASGGSLLSEERRASRKETLEGQSTILKLPVPEDDFEAFEEERAEPPAAAPPLKQVDLFDDFTIGVIVESGRRHVAKTVTEKQVENLYKNSNYGNQANSGLLTPRIASYCVPTSTPGSSRGGSVADLQTHGRLSRQGMGHLSKRMSSRGDLGDPESPNENSERNEGEEKGDRLRKSSFLGPDTSAANSRRASAADNRRMSALENRVRKASALGSGIIPTSGTLSARTSAIGHTAVFAQSRGAITSPKKETDAERTAKIRADARRRLSNRKICDEDTFQDFLLSNPTSPK